MTEDDELELIKKLDVLRKRHRLLDQKIFAISKQAPGDQFNLFRLKKEKLSIRDEIVQIESIIYPDIIA